MKYIGKFNEVVTTAPLSDNRIADTDSFYISLGTLRNRTAGRLRTAE